MPGKFSRSLLSPSPLTPGVTARINNIVLVHGAFVDGGGWEPVYNILKAKGYAVSIVQNPTTSLAADVAATEAIINLHNGPVVLAGHAYGGAVITEAGNHPKVSRLVYIAAFVPDSGESVRKLLASPPRGAPMPPLLAPVNGFLRLDQAKFAGAFAADLPPERAEFLANAQRPWSVDAYTDEVTMPAWRSKPSWYLVACDDQMIPPEAQRAMSKRAGATVAETTGSHAIYESRPDIVAAQIEIAARA